MSDESGNRRLAITEIDGYRGETVPQYMRRDIAGQAAQLCNSKPEFLEMQKRLRAASGCGEDPLHPYSRKAAQCIAGAAR